MRRYDLYGLACGNPYAVRTLDPLRRHEDHKLLHELDGFLELAAAERVIADAVQANEPAFFLITGENASGRTSLANYLLFRYREERGLAGRFLINVETNVGFAERERTWDTLKSLGNEMRFKGVPHTDEVARMLNTLGESPAPSDQQLLAFLMSANLAAHGDGWGYGVRFEGVPKETFVGTATTVFKAARTMVVFTHDDYHHAGTAHPKAIQDVKLGEHGMRIHLTPLKVNQVQRLAEARWVGADRHPFDPEGLAAIFDDDWRVVGRALANLAMLLDLRLADHGDTDVPHWPHDDLKLTREWLVPRVPVISAWRQQLDKMRNPHG